jgi:hypothetical protein
MDIQTEKLHLIEQLLQILDAKIILQIQKLLEKAGNPIVGYSSNGKAITQNDFVKEIEEAEIEYKSGKFQSIDEVDKESEAW